MLNQTAESLYAQWQMLVNDWINPLLNKLAIQDYTTEISSGLNHGIFILGHLVVSEDDLSLYLGKGVLLFPSYSEMFGQGASLKKPDEYPEVHILKNAWSQVCSKNEIIYKKLTDKELDEPHAMVKDYNSDYFKTKGKVVMAWQLHQAYHAGQLGMLHSKIKTSK